MATAEVAARQTARIAARRAAVSAEVRFRSIMLIP